MRGVGPKIAAIGPDRTITPIWLEVAVRSKPACVLTLSGEGSRRLSSSRRRPTLRSNIVGHRIPYQPFDLI
jgi:hypothetical protein